MGKISLEYGFNFDAFSKSDIHMHGPGYDFTLRDVSAKDRWQLKHPADLVNSVAQYNLRAGYAFDDHWSISAGIDHMKYVANVQTVRVDGWKERTMHIGKPDDVVGNFEHTNGLNLVDVEFAYSQPLVETGAFKLSARAGAGLGMVIPKSDVTMFGQRLDNVFHVAGAGFSAAASLRAEFYEYFYVDAKAKGGLIVLPDVLTVGAGKASHHFAFVEAAFTAGVQVKL